MSTRIKNVYAEEIISMRGHPGIETTVELEDGSIGSAIVTAGVSVGEHEVQFIHDGGSRYGGLGVKKAVEIVNNIIGPKIKGLDATEQHIVDEVMLKLDGTPNKSRLGGNSIASVSAAVLKAAARSLRLPLYRYIGGVRAKVLPVPGVGAVAGGDRYGGGQRSGEKPSYSFMAYGFRSFSEASYACWEISREFFRITNEKLGRRAPVGSFLLLTRADKFSHDREIWEMMTEAIENLGYRNRIGIQVDVAATTYYNREKKIYEGLFSRDPKTREDLIEIYKTAVKDFPFVIIEDPLEEEDMEGHAILTRELGVEIVGDDLFTTNIERVKRGIEAGACNAVLLKVNQIGTITEAFEMVEFAYRHCYGVMPCSSRGEGVEIADYAVGLNTGHIRESGLGDVANRLMKIEMELGRKATFLGKEGLKLK
ncbi:MAG: enolase C-terminal domain-like protein [Candidatus Bathyarchaeia archaeon]